jgi:MOSC domain-containing protein YiiM
MSALPSTDQTSASAPLPRLAHIHISEGGVPKLPVPHVEVTFEGCRGDSQRNLKFHGGPDRALCLWSLELIEALQAEGHPIAPGSTGENLTLVGLDWPSLTPGTQLQVGALLLEITDYAAPCRTIQACFTGWCYGRISHRRHPGFSRLYAKVLQPGTIQVGDRTWVKV